ncbi:putative FAD-binding domain-containing protein [Seiridium cardinale]|uniref:FAD-binding domain-containing protein n=1 Tax=Seiridium cardinale TaxID=138064 RepID=A0ABR2Y141_9PEZI
MDPLSAVSVTAAIVQFSAFGSVLLRARTTSTNSLRLLEDAETKLDRSWPDSVAPASLSRLCHECRDIKGDTFEIVLEKLRVGGTSKLKLSGKTNEISVFKLAVQGFRVTLRKFLVHGEIDELKSRLNEVKQQVTMAILSLLMNESGRHGVDIQDFAQQQPCIATTLASVDETTKQFSANVRDLIFVPNGTRHEPTYMDGECSHRILRDLFFKPMEHREANIPQRYVQTFEWIFREPRYPEEDCPLWSSFPKRLEGESKEIYWITGKPGVGKSTLMQFICHDPMLTQFLKRDGKTPKILRRPLTDHNIRGSNAEARLGVSSLPSTLVSVSSLFWKGENDSALWMVKGGVLRGSGPESVIFACDVGAEGSHTETQRVVRRVSLWGELLVSLPHTALHANSKLASTRHTSESPETTMQDGKTMTFDAVIGADDIFSTVRKSIVGENEWAASSSGFWDCRTVVSLSRAKAAIGEPYLKSIDSIAGSCIISGIEKDSPPNRTRALPGQFLEEKLLTWNDGLIAEKMIYLLLDQPRPEGYSSWKHKSTFTYARGRVCTAGGAAHAMMSWQGAGGGQAFGDAMMLGALLREVSSKNDINAAFRAFDALAESNP